MRPGPTLETVGQERMRDRSKGLGGLLDSWVLGKSKGPWKEEMTRAGGKPHFLHICLEDHLKLRDGKLYSKQRKPHGCFWLICLPEVTSALGEEGSIRQRVQFRGNGICLLEPMTKQGPWSKSLRVFLFFFFSFNGSPSGALTLSLHLSPGRWAATCREWLTSVRAYNGAAWGWAQSNVPRDDAWLPLATFHLEHLLHFTGDS